MNDYPLPEDDDNHADYKSTHNDGMYSKHYYLFKIFVHF